MVATTQQGQQHREQAVTAQPDQSAHRGRTTSKTRTTNWVGPRTGSITPDTAIDGQAK